MRPVWTTLGAELVRVILARTGWSQAALAAHLGVRHQTVKLWSAGLKQPGRARLDQLAILAGYPEKAPVVLVPLPEMDGYFEDPLAGLGVAS